MRAERSNKAISQSTEESPTGGCLVSRHYQRNEVSHTMIPMRIWPKRFDPLL